MPRSTNCVYAQGSSSFVKNAHTQPHLPVSSSLRGLPAAATILISTSAASPTGAVAGGQGTVPCSLGPTGLARAPAQRRHPADICGLNVLATRLDATHCSLRESRGGGGGGGRGWGWGADLPLLFPTPADPPPASLPGPATSVRCLPARGGGPHAWLLVSLTWGLPPQELNEKSPWGRAPGREAPGEAVQAGTRLPAAPGSYPSGIARNGAQSPS